MLFCQFWHCDFKWSSRSHVPNYNNFDIRCNWNNAWSVMSWNFKNLWLSSGTENIFNLIQAWKWTFKKGRPYSTIANMISTRNFANPCRKIDAGTIMQGATPKWDEFMIKMGATKMWFDFDQADMWFNQWIISFDSFVFNNVLFEL